MKSKTIKKILWGTLSFLLLMIIVLGIHIYVMTRPKAPTATTRIMARIDFTQDITQSDADAITAWLYQQKGIDHVLCSQKNNVAVFTYYPVVTNANKIISDLKYHFSYKAERYIPSEKDLQSGCPVGANSITYKVYDFFKKTF